MASLRSGAGTRTSVHTRKEGGNQTTRVELKENRSQLAEALLSYRWDHLSTNNNNYNGLKYIKYI